MAAYSIGHALFPFVERKFSLYFEFAHFPQAIGITKANCASPQTLANVLVNQMWNQKIHEK